jgi:N utilization substance protein B
MTAQLDLFISEHAPEWPLDQVAIVDRNILRISLWEFAVSGITPIKVAINEAVELAKLYGSDSTPRFVNGVLGSLSIRQAEIRQTFQDRISQGRTSPRQLSESEDVE